MFKFPPKPWKLSARVEATDEIHGSLTGWCSPWREAKINHPFCTRDPDLSISHGHFSMAVLPCEVMCAIYKPRADGCSGRSMCRNKNSRSRKMLLKWCFTTFWCHIKHMNSRYEIREIFFKEWSEFCLKVIHTNSYAKSSARGGAQNWFTLTALVCRVWGLHGNGNCGWLSWCVWSSKTETHLEHSVCFCHRLPRKFTDTEPKYICTCITPQYQWSFNKTMCKSA